MKRILGLILFLAVVGCEKVDIEHNRDFNRSYKAWQSFKKSTGDSYKFTITGGTWAGYSWSTDLVVEKGQVTERHFRYTIFRSIRRPEGGWDEASIAKIREGMIITDEQIIEGYGMPLEKLLEWSERGEKLKTINDARAAGLMTLDDVYEKARTEWVIKRADAQVYFEAKNDGMISSGGYVINGCQDDCFMGITVSSIQRL